MFRKTVGLIAVAVCVRCAGFDRSCSTPHRITEMLPGAAK